MHIQFAELAVSDQDRARSFYVDHFGCEIVADVPVSEDGWRWIELNFAGAETALHFTRRKDEVPSADPVLVLVEDDVDAVAARLKSEGVEIVTGPRQAPYDPRRRVAEFLDSEGNRMVISSRL